MKAAQRVGSNPLGDASLAGGASNDPGGAVTVEPLPEVPCEGLDIGPVHGEQPRVAAQEPGEDLLFDVAEPGVSATGRGVGVRGGASCCRLGLRHRSPRAAAPDWTIDATPGPRRRSACPLQSADEAAPGYGALTTPTMACGAGLLSEHLPVDLLRDCDGLTGLRVSGSRAEFGCAARPQRGLGPRSDGNRPGTGSSAVSGEWTDASAGSRNADSSWVQRWG